MSEAFVGEIRMFAGNFAPRSWALCNGQLLAVSQNDALFSLFGTIYGGDGRTTFGLPDLRGRIPIHAGSGPGLTPRNLGAKGGAETVTVTTPQLPPHTHSWKATNSTATSQEPVGNAPAIAQGDMYTSDLDATNFNAAAISNTGGSQHHNNMAPFQCITYIVALFGIYPSRA
jgi:microcystin-dependent protein